MDAPLQFVAEISPVREVSLTGAADLSFWRVQLRVERLAPAPLDGQAQLLICGCDARFRGIRFQELSISVFVSRSSEASQPEGAYLIGAFNSNWFFALVERMWFCTPYEHAQIDVEVTLPASLRLFQAGKPVFQAEMDDKSEHRQEIRCGDEGWQGPIFLPGRGQTAGNKWFYGRIGGLTHVYPFLPDVDRLVVHPQSRCPALSRLIESGFTARHWILRHSAVHAKSKTYARDRVAALQPAQPAVAAAEA